MTDEARIFDGPPEQGTGPPPAGTVGSGRRADRSQRQGGLRFMGKSNRIRMRDARGIYLLVGECCELGWDLDAWRKRMAEGLSRIVPFRHLNCGMVTLADLASGRLPGPEDAAMFDWGADGGDPPPDYLNYWGRRIIWTDPTFAAMSTLALPESGPDRWTQTGSDHRLVLKITPRPECGVALFWLSLTRAAGDEPFTARERRTLVLFAHEIAAQLGGRLTTPNAATAEGLSPRLQEVLTLLVRGDSEKQVAAKLGISPHTVHDHVKRLHQHFNVSSRGELLARALHQP